MKVLITGGAGYIGSTTASALEEAGHQPVILDSLITGPREFTTGRTLYVGDIADRTLVRRVVEEHPDIHAVIHMAAFVVVPDSTVRPADYYRNNVSKSLDLFEQLSQSGLRRVLFSSSASVYAPSPTFEVDESSPLAPGSPYAETKAMVEQMLTALARAGQLDAVSLRYFNPLGADPQLRSGIHVPLPTHVLGQLVAAARGDIDTFKVTGTAYPTRDGTGLRDYLHVWDLAQAHVAAIERFDELVASTPDRHCVLNVGTGRGTTVRELIGYVEAVLDRPVPVVEAPPRPGDVVGAFANVDRASELLGWRSQYSIADAVRSALAWAERRPEILGDRVR